jgi:(1->4)-alpha-D-glucan 1-alpha-D-glucosylmutase
MTLRASYRLQLNASFTLRDALNIVPQLDTLGVSHLYCAPMLAARPGSVHGYDVVDPTRLNPALGTNEDLRALAAELHGRGMGLMLDIVPNHMAAAPENPFWWDVLERGEASRYARWFDVDWAGNRSRKLLLPVLGDGRARVIQRGEIRVRVTESGTWIEYFDKRFPLDPATLPEAIQLARWDPVAAAHAESLYEGEAGRQALESLLARQHYQLMHWRRAPHALNYRRFFDINDLVALRMEDPQVFAETHALVLSWVAEGIVDALRVDHIDGLRDPAAYLERLRRETSVRRDTPIPIFVEKILSPGETLRQSWPVAGTTGYEFLNDVEDLFVHPAGYASMESAYRGSRRATGPSFAAIARDGKLAVLAGPLHADVKRLSRLLAPMIVAARAGPWKPTDVDAGIRELIASLPVYRTYITRDRIDDEDVRVIEAAASDCARRVAGAVGEVARFVTDVLLDRVPTAGEERMTFVGVFQQTSGPATAKGVEDTALYRYVPLASRNEVGGAPDRSLDDAVDRFHGGNAERARRWPSALLATNTHDTKRSADVRARIDVLSEIDRDWRRHVARWRRLNRRHRQLVDGKLAPDVAAEWLFYQTLIGIWPTLRAGRRADDLPDGDWLVEARKRLVVYMMKAVKEAKVRTSWTEPNEAFEAAVRSFVEGVVAQSPDAPFLGDVARAVHRIAPAASRNALARVLLHLTSPGTPDLYQGDELPTLSLVDPDNRRPVDYATRAQLLASLQDGEIDAAQPHAKLAATARLLRLRRERPALFQQGTYEPIAITGERAEHLVAFHRSAGDDHLVTVACRLTTALTGRAGIDWRDTALVIPHAIQGREMRGVLSTRPVRLEARVDVASLLTPLAMDCFVSTPPDQNR